MFGRKAKEIKTLWKLNGNLWKQCYEQKQVISELSRKVIEKSNRIVGYIKEIGELREKIYTLEENPTPKSEKKMSDLLRVELGKQKEKYREIVDSKDNLLVEYRDKLSRYKIEVEQKSEAIYNLKDEIKQLKKIMKQKPKPGRPRKKG